MKAKFRVSLIFTFLMSILLVSSVFAEELLVVLPGTIQGALGGGDWDPTGEVTKMTLVGEDVYEFTGTFPAGNYEYKVAVGGTWDENYGIDGQSGGDNIKLSVPEDNFDVTFTFDYNTKIISDTINGEGVSSIAAVAEEKPVVEEIKEVTRLAGELQVRLPGTIQSALGGGEWDPAGDITLMTYKGNDIYEFVGVFPKGNYEYKVTIGGTWDENYGQDGAEGGSNIALTVPSDDTEVKFIFDYKNKTIKQELEIKGFNYIPILTDTIEKKGKDANYNITNEFDFGIVSKNLVLNSKTSFNFDVDKEDYSIIEDSVEDKNLSLKDVELEELTLDYTNNEITYGLMINQSKYKPSKDFFGILDASTESDDRDHTKNPEDIDSKNLALKLSTEKFADIDLAVSTYKKEFFEKQNEQRTFGKMEIEKNLLNDKLKIGTSNILYAVSHDGESEDTVINSTLYTQMELMDTLTFKGQMGIVPTGNIIDRAGVTIEKSGSLWNITVTPSTYGADDIDEIHLVGAFQGWKPEDLTYDLTDNGNGTWTIENVSATEGTEFKFVYNGTTWDNNIGSSGLGGSNFTFKELIPTSEGLDYGLNMYLAELNYNLFDKGILNLGTKSLAANVYMPFAKDDVFKYGQEDDMYDDEYPGYIEYYLNGDYKVLDNLKLTLNKVYKTQEANSDLMLSDELKVGFDMWDIPIVEYVKGHYLQDPDQKDGFNAEKKEVYLETNFNKVPFVKHVKISTSQRFESETQQYYLETELKDYSKYIDHIKGNVTYAVDDANYADQGGDALQYWTEIKLHNLPGINKYIPYILASYESDDNGNTGIVESEDYYDKDDNDNDWLEKIYVESKFDTDKLKDWDGITAKYEMRKIEKSKTEKVDDPSKDSQYYVASERSFVNWYTIITLSTEYKFPYDIKGKFTYKYDLTHQNTSEWEDDGLKIELEKKIGITTINASYNKQDDDEGDDYLKISFKSVF